MTSLNGTWDLLCCDEWRYGFSRVIQHRRSWETAKSWELELEIDIIWTTDSPT